LFTFLEIIIMTINLLPMQDIAGPSVSIIVKVSKYTLSIMLRWLFDPLPNSTNQQLSSKVTYKSKQLMQLVHTQSDRQLVSH